MLSIIKRRFLRRLFFYFIMTDKKTIIMELEYDGTTYAGWQRQSNALAIQEVVENALSRTFNRPMTCIGAGRTDAGVHARGQVAHSILREKSNIAQDNIIRAINSNLPADICVRNAVLADFKFHATSDAIAREYSFSLHTVQSVFLRHFSNYYKFNIELDKLNDIAPIFIGKHNFTTFSKHNAETKSYECNIEFCFWEKVSEHHRILHIKANRFVYGMVRGLVGVMIDYARSRRTLDEIKSSFADADRSKSSPLVSPQGLVLEKVYYAIDIF